MYYLGLDIGSTTSKCVIVDENGKPVGKGLFDAAAGTQGPKNAVNEALKSVGNGISEDQIKASCATGYGRHLDTTATYEMSELSCHAKGATKLFPGVRTVIDIGGQDAKVLSLDKDGTLRDFQMNDKCAAGTGRFLEMMATVFRCKASDLSDLDKKADKVVAISSTCSVFAESEVVSKLASGYTIPEVAAGVDQSVADKTAGLVRRVGVVPPVAMTGGVALNESLRKRLGEKIGYDIETNDFAQYNGAYGAALYAIEKSSK